MKKKSWKMTELKEPTHEEVPTWSHDFDEGPSKLEEHELEALDRQSRKTEVERLRTRKSSSLQEKSKL